MSEVADRYRRRANAFEATIIGTPPDRWTSPSPCEGWRACDVVAHVVQYSALVLHGGPSGPTTTAADGFDPTAAFRATRADVERVLDDPATAPELVQEIDLAVSFDLPQHRWDLAVATGQDATIDADDLDALWDALSPQSPKWWEFMRTPGRFGPGIVVYGPEVAVRARAPRQDRLLGLLGRDPNWVPRGEGSGEKTSDSQATCEKMTP
jgi:uncharacterized protein (TIGR03083 family)